MLSSGNLRAVTKDEAAARRLAVITARLQRYAHQFGEQGFSKTTDLLTTSLLPANISISVEVLKYHHHRNYADG